MSRASKFTLVGTSLMTAGIVYFVHWTQEADKAVCFGWLDYAIYVYLLLIADFGCK